MFGELPHIYIPTLGHSIAMWFLGFLFLVMVRINAIQSVVIIRIIIIAQILYIYLRKRIFSIK